MDMDEDVEAHLVVVVVECQKRDSQTDSTIIYIDYSFRLSGTKLLPGIEVTARTKDHKLSTSPASTYILKSTKKFRIKYFIIIQHSPPL